jgi:hypothetical protein
MKTYITKPPMFLADSFVITPNWKPKCPLLGKLLNKSVVYLYNGIKILSNKKE